MYTYSDELFSDLHKDAYGVRPSARAWADWEAATPAERQAQWDRLVARMLYEEECDRAREQQAVAQFEAAISVTLASGAKTREQAIRWLVQAEDCEDDVDRFRWRLGLPYAHPLS